MWNKPILFIFLSLFSAVVAAKSCNFKLQIKYMDDSVGCIQDLPFANNADSTGEKLIDAVNSSHDYIVAISKTANCKAMGVEKIAFNRTHTLRKAKSFYEQSAIDKCMNLGCDCELVISEGVAVVEKNKLMGFSSPMMPVVASVVKSEDKKILLDSKKELAVDPVAQAVKSLNVIEAPLQTDSDRLVALRRELESEIRASIQKEFALNQARPPQVIKPEKLIYANRRALVIGNDGYKKIPALVNAKEDARVVAENLNLLGYKVILKLDLSEKQFKSELRSFKDQVDAGDEVAIFYAGHGVQIGSTNFLLPVDIAGESEEQVKDEAISLQRLLDDMSDKKAKFTLAMIDACRDNPFKGSGRSIAGSRGLAPTTAATGQMIVFSAGTGQQALDKLGPSDKSKNGLFTRIFVNEMQKTGVTVDRVVRNVRAEVVALAKSVGHEQVPAIYDQVVGEFYFRK